MMIGDADDRAVADDNNDYDVDNNVDMYDMMLRIQDRLNVGE